MRASTNISTKNIKQMRVEEFRGVDFSSSPLRAASYRATSAKNWIRRDGANQKRNGWRQKIIDENLTNPIKGMYQYKKGQYTFLLVLTANGESGKARIYVKSSGEWIYNNTEYTFNTVSGIQQIQAFQKNGKFFILTGINIYVYDYSATTPSVYALVNNNNITAYEAYQADQNRTGAKIPTTTISIDPVGTIDTNRETLDAVNILTPFRKNTLLGSGSSNQEYRLDGYFDAYSNYSDEKMLIKISERQQNIEHGMYEEVVNYYIFKYGHTDDTNGNIYKLTIDEEQGTPTIGNSAIGKVHSEGNGNAIIKFFNEHVSLVSGKDNIEVIFFSDTPSDHSAIKLCKLGAMFGIGGNFDRLFISGSSSNKNRVWFSEADDFTYFPDTYTADIGTDNSAVTGFLALSDNSFAVFKEQTYRDPSIAYLSGEYQYKYDDAGNLKKMTPVFHITSGASEESPLNNYVMADLSGDKIFASASGVYAIYQSENYATTQRLLRSRSIAIDKTLTAEEHLDKAVAITHKGKYYLAVNGHVYVADSLMKYQPTDYDAYNYEWYFWDNVPAVCWAIVDNELWFGCADGRVCAFDDDTLYKDTSYVYIGNGNITTNGNAFTYDEGIDNYVKVDRKIVINEHTYYVLSVDNTNHTLSLKQYPEDTTAAAVTTAVTYTGYIVVEIPVVSEWVTPVFDFGVNDATKFLQRITLSLEPELDGKLKFGFKTTNGGREMLAKGIQFYDADALDFNNFTVDTDHRNSYTVPCGAIFNYISFYFRSESATNCCVNNMTVQYRINKQHVGVR